jgi:hypothetical protein
MNTRHQRGHLRCTRRTNGPSVGKFLWKENDANGKRVRRTVVIGNVDQYPSQDLALAAVNGLRVSINEACNRQRQRSVLIGDLVDHYTDRALRSSRVVFRGYQGYLCRVSEDMENSPQPTKLCERVMRGFKSSGHAPRFLSAFESFPHTSEWEGICIELAVTAQ